MDGATLIAIGSLGLDAYDAWARSRSMATLDPVGREAALAHLDEMSKQHFASGKADAESAIEQWRRDHPELKAK